MKKKDFDRNVLEIIENLEEDAKVLDGIAQATKDAILYGPHDRETYDDAVSEVSNQTYRLKNKILALGNYIRGNRNPQTSADLEKENDGGNL